MTEQARSGFPVGVVERACADSLTNAELQIVLDTVRDLTSMLSTQKIIDRLLERILTHLGSEIGSVLVLDEDESLRIMVARGLPGDIVGETRVAMGEGISGFVAKSREPLLIENIEEDERFRRRNHERYYTRSLLSAPLAMGREVYGVLNVNNKSNRSVFDPVDLRLLEAIAGHAAVALNAAKRYEDAVDRSQRDPLTGLANHRHFWETLETEVGRADRYGRVVSVVMLDIDRFKEFNDSHGHLAGDDALKLVARAIESGCRASDLAGRYGGEEFAIVLPETPAEGARVFAQKIRASIESAQFAGASHPSELTASLGVATYPAEGQTATDLVRVADSRLYQAKAAGRNQVVAGPATTAKS